MKIQQTLAIQLNHQACLSNFCWGEQALLKQEIEKIIRGQGEPFVYIWGNPGSGKSHLLQACCRAYYKHDSAIYLPLDILKEWGPASIEGMSQHDLIALDNLDAVAGDAYWEEALFHFYNRVRDNDNACLLISGQHAPTVSPVRLPDLRSRLAWGLVVHLKELSDDLKIVTIQEQAHKRGFHLSTSVAQFLINRCARNMHDLQSILNQLDDASLAAQRKITIPFVKSVLGV
ncbi:DnaA regulatory inactivator Hda [Legionella spiritensis]|uniref:ATPase regulatory factor involved in DnaA inactivation n=1 Tax=Legionella spiritensis TaxID=452 RepID=A0A0W0Z6K2_LEGSP|nr:DnaA regulatory inactivator Hda [Legionella spiritensis]KTD64744.1 ATPase regulatory factor involved in DnaA inactivation [Legionella spiritensis]SNV48162.1 ATPase regulatory factor involved in DnaA inactivation [Legionella spiritensis]